MTTASPPSASPSVPLPRSTGRGSALVLLHGNFASPRWWRLVCEQLPSDVTAFAPDMRRWVDRGRTTIPDLAARLVDFIQTRNLVQPVVVGHSLGGIVAMQFALDHPNLPRALVLISTAPPTGVPLGHLALGGRLAVRHPWVTWTWLRRQAMRAALRKAGLSRHHPLADALVEDASATDPAIYAAFSHAVGGWNASEQLAGLMLPTLLIWGEQDPVMPVRIGWQLRGLIPNSRLVTLPGVGHSPPVEAPELIVRHLLVFLDEGASVAPELLAPTPRRSPRQLLRRLTHWFKNRIPNERVSFEL